MNRFFAWLKKLIQHFLLIVRVVFTLRIGQDYTTRDEQGTSQEGDQLDDKESN